MILVSLLFISGCYYNDCDKLAEKFEECGSHCVNTKEPEKSPWVGGTLISISDPMYYEPSTDDIYHLYDLTFEGITEQQNFTM